jgi:hypothetical protein
MVSVTPGLGVVVGSPGPGGEQPANKTPIAATAANTFMDRIRAL